MRDHGGDLDRAMQEFGAGDWLDLSTGINAAPYPVPSLEARAWAALPTRSDIAALEATASQTYGAQAQVVALGGAQAAIQLVPRLREPGRACVVGPTYNEHAAALRAQGWQVEIVTNPAQGAGADLLTVVNPNNPDGRIWPAETLLALRDKVGLLVVDESFADTESPSASVVPYVTAGDDRLVVMRSFGKFYGLAGVRLGFAITGGQSAQTLRALAGPWAVNGPAVAVGRRALADTNWQNATRARLTQDAKQMDDLAAAQGWTLIGGTPLFRTYATPDAQEAQNQLARGHVWSRIFPYSDSWIRLGLPGSAQGWDQLSRALSV